MLTYYGLKHSVESYLLLGAYFKACGKAIITACFTKEVHYRNDYKNVIYSQIKLIVPPFFLLYYKNFQLYFFFPFAPFVVKKEVISQRGEEARRRISLLRLPQSMSFLCNGLIRFVLSKRIAPYEVQEFLFSCHQTR